MYLTAPTNSEATPLTTALLFSTSYTCSMGCETELLEREEVLLDAFMCSLTKNGHTSNISNILTWSFTLAIWCSRFISQFSWYRLNNPSCTSCKHLINVSNLPPPRQNKDVRRQGVSKMLYTLHLAQSFGKKSGFDCLNISGNVERFSCSWWCRINAYSYQRLY